MPPVAAYTVGPMACTELQRLRAKATETKKALAVQRRIARQHALETRGRHTRGRSDYEPMLERRLLQLGNAIERHLSRHQCQN